MRLAIGSLFGGRGVEAGRKVSRREARRFRPTTDGLEARIAMSFAWTEDYPNYVSALLVQRFIYGGQFTAKLGTPVLVDYVDRKGTTREYEPSIAFDSQGKFVVSWLTEDLSPQNLTSTVMARRFDASGNPLGASFIVNAGTKAQDPHIVADATGDFVVAYTTNNLPSSDIQAKL